MTTSRPADRIPPTFESAAERGLTTPRAAGVAGIIFAVLFFVALALLGEVVGVGLATETVMDNLNGPSLGPRRWSASTWCRSRGSRSYGSSASSATASAPVKTGSSPPRSSAAACSSSPCCSAPPPCSVASSRATASARRRPTDIATVGFARSVGYSFLFVYSAKCAGIFMLATSTIVRRSGWPRWTSLSGFIVALVLILSVSFFEPIVMLLPAWVAAISVYVLVTGGRRPAEATGNEQAE